MSTARLWGVMPAAGSGKRFGEAIPKQYLRLIDKPVIQHSIDALLAIPGLSGLTVALSADDCRWQNLAAAADERVQTVTGGQERADSVLAALDSLSEVAADNDWVLVHDAARPCIDLVDVHRLLKSIKNHDVGGLLALPVADTLKRCDVHNNILASVDRSKLWSAQTPQIFRFGLLRECLAAALQSGSVVTDESMAAEIAGYQPLVVAGSPDNIKITLPAHLRLAEFLLRGRR